MVSFKCAVYPRLPKATGCRKPRWFLTGEHYYNIKIQQSESAQAGHLRRGCRCEQTMHKRRRPEHGQNCPQYLLAGMVEYGVNFATFQPLDAEPLDAETLDLLHDSLRGMWRTEEEERDVSEGELSASSSESSDEAMIPCTFSQSVLQQMRPGGGEVHGSSAGTENPLRSLLASFVSGQSDDEDDNSQQPGSQAEEAPPQRARGPNAFGGGRKRKAT